MPEGEKLWGVPVVIGGDDLPFPFGLGLTDLTNIGPPVPASLIFDWLQGFFKEMRYSLACKRLLNVYISQGKRKENTLYLPNNKYVSSSFFFLNIASKIHQQQQHHAHYIHHRLSSSHFFTIPKSTNLFHEICLFFCFSSRQVEIFYWDQKGRYNCLS